MSLYETSFVDETVKAELCTLLAQTQAAATMHVLEMVFWDLLVTAYPLEESYRWVTGDPTPPVDLVHRRDVYFDQRRLLSWFWHRLSTTAYGPPQQRLPDGVRQPALDAAILQRITRISFDSAINTWLAICVTWLQICNVDWYAREVQRSPQLAMWQPGEEHAIPCYVAGMMELIYF